MGITPLEERIDTTSAADELVVHASGAIAQFERRQISLRTKGNYSDTPTPINSS